MAMVAEAVAGEASPSTSGGGGGGGGGVPYSNPFLSCAAIPGSNQPVSCSSRLLAYIPEPPIVLFRTAQSSGHEHS